MTNKEYIYRTEDNTIINVIQLKASQNSKIGFGIVVQTYHFSIDQIKYLDFTMDSLNCLNCPLSHANRVEGSPICYTHKGLQRMGLISMMKRLNKMLDKIGYFNEYEYTKFYNKAKDSNINLVRFGAYGEPIFLGEFITGQLAKLGDNITGYTHTYKEPKYKWANRYFMASTHNSQDRIISKENNFRSFNVLLKTDSLENSVNCPSSKEHLKAKGTKVSCINCSLCSGNYKNLKKDIHILIH